MAAETERRVNEAKTAWNSETAALLQAAEAKWKSETDQRFAIAEEMFKEIYEEQLETVQAKWRTEEEQRLAAAREVWMAEARAKNLAAGASESDRDGSHQLGDAHRSAAVAVPGAFPGRRRCGWRCGRGQRRAGAGRGSDRCR